MYGARPHNDNKAVILSFDDLDSCFSASNDSVYRLFCRRNLSGEQSGRNERIIAED
jgi:hypothetical protein